MRSVRPATRPGRTCTSRSGCAAPRSIRRAPCRNADFPRDVPSGRGREALPDDTRADARAARGAGGDRAAGHPPPRARLPRALRGACSRACARSSAPSRRCSSSAAPAPAAMESAVANLCSPGDPVLVVSAGYFGERWAAIAKAYGAEVDHLALRLGRDPRRPTTSPRGCASARRLIVFFTHSETSTGVVLDPQPFAAAAREAGALSVVDAVSSLGAVPLETDAWGLDVVASGAQKALMTPPGPRDDDSARPTPRGSAPPTATSPRFYWDWERTRKGQATLDAPVTPPVSLVAGLDVALGMLLEEGLEAAFDRHRRLGRACREGAEGDGPRALLARRRQLGGRDRGARARGDRLRRARAAAARPPRRHARAGPGRAQGQDLPHRPHRLLRRLRHHDRARRGRARARSSSARRSSAASRSPARSRRSSSTPV